MPAYNAIEAVSGAIIEDEICDAILLKGSFGRGDNDEYSDVDMYVVLNENAVEIFRKKQMEYLNAYMPVVYQAQVNFGIPQTVAIFENGLHFDLYAATREQIGNKDKIRVIYDKNKLFAQYRYTPELVSNQHLARLFNEEILYYFVEADAAYKRRNTPWAAHIMRTALADAAVLLRSLYDRELACLGLKKINEIVPPEQFEWIKAVSENLTENGMLSAGKTLVKILDSFCAHTDEECRALLDMNFFNWIKWKLTTGFFVKPEC